MRKLVWSLVCCLIVVVPLGCGGKYSDVHALNEEYVNLLEEYLSTVEKADSAEDVAAALNDYADDLEKLWPRMQKLSEKYPELKDQENLPPEIKASQAETEEVAERFVGSFMKIMPYMRDPEVRQAQERIGKIMTGS